MSKLLLIFIFVSALACMYRWGIGKTFAYVYLPAILFFNSAIPMSLKGIPNLTASSAVGYAVCVGLLFRWHELKALRFNVIDAMMLLLLIPPAISTGTNTGAWESISQTGELFFVWIMPYLMARIALQDAESRKAALTVLCVCAGAIGFMAMIEARLKPYAFSRALEDLNLIRTNGNVQVLWRFGLARAMATTGQPIDLGACGVLLGSMILLLTPAVGRKWHNALPLIGILGCGAMVVCSVSFTGFLAMVAAFGMFVTFSIRGMGRWLVVPAIICIIGAMAFQTNKWVNQELSTDRPTEQAAASEWIRVRIVQDSWDIATSSGPFGYGKYLPTDKIGVGSVDNAYLLFIMQTGWTYLLGWLILMVVLAIKGAVALKHAGGVPSMRFPMAAGLAGCFAIFLAMFTVFYGFVYALLLCVLMGMISSMTQMYKQHAAPQSSRGFAVMPTPVRPGGFVPAGGAR